MIAASPVSLSAMVWVYAEEDYFSSLSVIGSGAVPLVRQSPGGEWGSMPMNAIPNPSEIIATRVEQSTQEIIGNVLSAVGWDSDKNQPIVAYWEDEGSISDRSQTNWVGKRWLWMLISNSMSTEASVKQTLIRAIPHVCEPTRKVDFDVPDLRMELRIVGYCQIEGYTSYGDSADPVYCLITDIVSQLVGNGSGALMRKSTYVAEIIEEIPT